MIFLILINVHKTHEPTKTNNELITYKYSLSSQKPDKA